MARAALWVFGLSFTGVLIAGAVIAFVPGERVPVSNAAFKHFYIAPDRSSGGAGQIAGAFTAESADELAILLRSGVLPAPLRVVEQRTAN